MASPPHSYSPSGSPPSYHQSLSFPMTSKKRSAEFAGGQPPSLKRRKASTLSVSSIPSPHPGHPLRQASFPPPEEYAAAYSRSPSVDSAAPSMISAAGPPKKKRGRKPKSAASGVEPPTRAQTPSVAGPDGGAQAQLAADDPQNDADDDDFDPELNAGVDMTTAQETDENKETETRLRSLLIGNLDKEQAIRYEKWKTFRVPDAAVRRVVNATVSQSVPANVVLAVRSVVKVFIGELVEASRRVQEEWIASIGEKQTETGDQPPPLPGCSPNPTGRKGPLRPDHVREAYRRYKMSNEGGGAGVMGAWHYQNHSGVERFATRAGGKRLFR